MFEHLTMLGLANAHHLATCDHRQAVATGREEDADMYATRIHKLDKEYAVRMHYTEPQ